MKQISPFKVCWYSVCPHCHYSIQYKIETSLSKEELQNAWNGHTEFFIQEFKDTIFYIEDPVYSTDGGKNYVSQYIEKNSCYQCHRSLIIFTTSSNKLNITNFVENVLWDYMTDRTKSIWLLFKSHPNINKIIESYSDFIGSSNLFSVGGMYNDNRIYWCTIDEVNPYSQTIYSIFDWIITKYELYFTENISEIKYDAPYVISKLIENSSLNYIDLNHPDLMIYQQFLEDQIYQNNISNSYSDQLLQKFNTTNKLFI